MNINFKQPRYMVPLIVLPFLLIFSYVYLSSFGQEPNAGQQQDSLQNNVSEVSAEVKNAGLSDKLGALQQDLRQGDGYTALGNISQEQVLQQQMPDLYNAAEKRMLDSLDQLSKRRFSSTPYPEDANQQLASALARMKAPPVEQPMPLRSEQPDPMDLFRKQMALVDSMGKASDPDHQAGQKRHKQQAPPEVKEAQQKLSVSRAEQSAVVFNTIVAGQKETFIKAMVDQDITAYAGSRLRIRLLDDMTAGRFLIKAGAYLYAQISGFSGQRVNLTVSTILQDNHILPVRLEIYDLDGIPGLYVPASAFREFSKELGTDAGEGMTLQQQAESNNQLVMSVLQKMFQSTTTAVTKLIRSNKANIKYNTLVYLIDPDELKTAQKNY